MENTDTKEQKRRDCRLASRLQDQITAGRRESLDRLLWRMDSCINAQHALSRLRQRLQTGRDSDRQSVIERLKGQLARFLPDLVEQLTVLQGLVQSHIQPLATCNDLVDELEQLRREFVGFRYEHKEKTLSVTTDDIVLQDETLGAFEIRLNLPEVGQPEPRSSYYRVVALDPHPPVADEGITHPHVSDSRLCEGDASMAIRSALSSGRLSDFYLLVARVLNTYNAGSAYVPLERWAGNSCGDCGATINSDDNVICDRCENEFCSDCTNVCVRCEGSVCHECGRDCDGCGQALCVRCATECSGCAGQFCESCLTEGMCGKCREKQQLTEEDKNHEEQTTEQVAPLPPGA